MISNERSVNGQVIEDFLNGKIHRFLSIGAASDQEIESVRAEVIDDLTPITSLEHGAKRFKRKEREAAVEGMDAYLAHLCLKINQLKAAPGLIGLGGRPKINLKRRLQSRTQGVFSWGAGDWKILFVLAQPSGLRQTIYAHIAAGLVSGEMARLRRCGYCGKFFIASQSRMTFCPKTDHARLFYDQADGKKFVSSPLPSPYLSEEQSKATLDRFFNTLKQDDEKARVEKKRGRPTKVTRRSRREIK